MSVAIQINNIDGSANGELFVEGILVPSGSYVTGGDSVDFTGVSSTITKGTGFSGIADSITSQFLKQFWVGSSAGLLTYQYAGIVPASNSPSGAKLKCGASATFGTELSAGAYPAGITGDTIQFQATFKKNNV